MLSSTQCDPAVWPAYPIIALSGNEDTCSTSEAAEKHERMEARGFSFAVTYRAVAHTASAPRAIVVSAQVCEDFRLLVEAWQKERGSTSSTTKMLSCPAYQKIIGLGEQAIPLLLGELRRQPDFYFAALRAVARVDPVPPDARGNLRRMTEAWLRWGIDAGYITPEAANGHQ